MRSLRRVRLLACLVVTACLAGCGTHDSSTVASDFASPPAPGNVLTFTDAHHRTYTMSPHSVKCAVGDNGHGVKTVQVFETDRRERLGIDIEVVPVSKPTTYSLPLDGGDAERGPRNAYLFAALLVPRDVEVSTREELNHPRRDAGGRLTVLEATCDPARLRMTIDGTLGSEYFEAEELRVSGGIDVGGS